MPAPRAWAPKLPPAGLRRATATASGEYWLDCALDGEPATAAVGAELAAARRLADGRGAGVTACTVAGAAGALAATGAVTARLTWLPWLGSTVITTAAAAAARTRSVTAPAAIPVRKLTSSSRALMAARMPGPEPTVR